MEPRVLVIDDDRVVADSLAMILSTKGFEVRTAYGGTEGVRLAAEFDPHVVISDVMMPGVDGVDTAVRIHQYLPKCKILLLSGELEAARELMERKFASFELLSKPVSPQLLLFKLRSSGSSRRAAT